MLYFISETVCITFYTQVFQAAFAKARKVDIPDAVFKGHACACARTRHNDYIFVVFKHSFFQNIQYGLAFARAFYARTA